MKRRSDIAEELLDVDRQKALTDFIPTTRDRCDSASSISACRSKGGSEASIEYVWSCQ